MVCDSLFKKRRPLVWSKLRTQVLIFKAILGVPLSCFLVEVLKPVLSEVRFDGENGTSREMGRKFHICKRVAVHTCHCGKEAADVTSSG